MLDSDDQNDGKIVEKYDDKRGGMAVTAVVNENIENGGDKEGDVCGGLQVWRGVPAGISCVLNM